MLTAKEAVAIAAKYMTEIYKSPEGLLVEEIELLPDENVWTVTMGFWQPLPPRAESHNALLSVLGEPRRVRRTYKEIRVRASDGEVLSMKIRSLHTPELR